MLYLPLYRDEERREKDENAQPGQSLADGFVKKSTNRLLT